MPEKKYELTDEEIEFNGHILYRIRALKDFGDVQEGDLGGFIESEDNLSHEGNCWIGDEVKVFGNAKVYENAEVTDNALVFGNAEVYGVAEVYEYASVYGSAKVYDKADVYGHAMVFGNAVVKGNAEICGNVLVEGNAEFSKGKVFDLNFKKWKKNPELD